MKQIEVIQVYDRHDQQWFLEQVEAMGKTGAHIYTIESADPDFGPCFVVSDRPLSPRGVQRAYFEDQKEQAREALKSGDSPEDVWHMYAVSACDINRIAKEERIALPRNWFALTQRSDAVATR